MSETTKPQPSGAPRRRNRRRQIIVNKPMQTRLVFTTSGPTAVCLAATGVVLALACKRLYDEALQVDVELPSLLLVFGVSAAFLVVASAYVLFSALMLSHRIAGPIYNMSKTMERFRGGDRDARVRLRKRDHLHEAAAEINTTLEWMAQQLDQRDAGAAGTAEPSPECIEIEPAAAASATED